MGSRSGTPGRRIKLRVWLSQLDAGQRRSLLMMATVVIGLHLIGFLTLFALVAPKHFAIGGGTGAFTVGIGLTAYTLGMRHAFDADHISAIDNTTRKLLQDGKQPMSVGFWFSLGHSTVVFLLAFLISLGVRSLDGPVRNGHSALHQATGYIGTGVSGVFLYLIAGVNLVILLQILGVFRQMRRGEFDEAALERQLAQRGFMNRFFGRFTKRVEAPHQMYPIGILFGLGFDTATEVALLVVASSAGAAGLPWYAILCLPVLFAAGMSLLDSIDGSLMNFAYGWAFSRPVRKVFYNLTITGLSVLMAVVIGTVELFGLLGSEAQFSGSNTPGTFWYWLEHIDINELGFIIVGLFLGTWVIAMAVWKFGKVEARWTAGLEPADAGATDVSPLRAYADVSAKRGPAG